MTTPEPINPPNDTGDEDIRSAMIISAVIAAVILIGIIALAIVLALNADAAGPGVEILRDVVIILISLEMVLIGAAFIVLLVQFARLVNLVNNEVQPLLKSANDTVNTVRGTATFMSKHLTEPVMQANSAISGIMKTAKEVDAIRAAAGFINTTHTSSRAPVFNPEPGQNKKATLQKDEAPSNVEGKQEDSSKS